MNESILLKESKWTYIGKFSSGQTVTNYSDYSEIKFTALTSGYAGSVSEFKKSDLVSAGITYVQNINSASNCTLNISTGVVVGNDGIFWGIK